MRRLASSVRLASLAVLLTSALAAIATPAAAAPLRVFIRAGAKTHGPGAHDWPAFLRDWRPLLESRGVKVEGAQRFPTAEELARTDVVVFATAGGGMHGADERARFKAFLDRGGGVVVLHDGLVATDPAYWSAIVGGAFEEGRSKWYEGKVGIYTVAGAGHPITAGAASFFLEDEIYWDLHLRPGTNVLAQAFRTVQEITPQIWTYEPGKARAFVSLIGHNTASFALPHVRALVLRGIAWAGRRPVDELARPEELAALRYPAGGPTPPARAAAAIRVHPDFDLSLVAAEPDVKKPASLDWDARGRLWVVEMPQYPEKAKPGQTGADQIVIFEDRDGDGRWDARKVFCDGLDMANSLTFHRDGVIVSQPPEILLLRDTDGDDRCDERQVLYRGFGIFDTHAVISNLRFGTDGWIYGDQGYSGNDSRDIVGAGGKHFGAIGNGVFRFKADGSAIEQVSSFGGNTWGIDFTWDDELVYTMANGSHLRHVVLPEAVLARGKVGQTPSWKDVTTHHEAAPLVHHTQNPYVQIDHVGGFTAASGSTVYTGGAWPPAWNGVHFVSEPTINLVHVDGVSPAGATLTSKRLAADEIVASRDLWFRPVDTRVGPDGALYIADWYNLAAVHNDTRGPKHGAHNAAIRPDRDHTHGRLWRLQHKQARSLPQPKLASASAAKLVATLEHPNRWYRVTAQRLLMERGAGATDAAALLERTSDPAARVHALWLLRALRALDEAALVRALGDKDAGVRKVAARLAALVAADAGDGGGAAGAAKTTGNAGTAAARAGLKKALTARLADADARVRMQSVVALGALASSGAKTPTLVSDLVALYPKLEDDWSRSAVVGSLAPRAAEAIARAGRPTDAATTAKLVPLAEELAGLAHRQGGPAIAKVLARLQGGPVASAVLGRLGRDWKGDASADPAARTGAAALARLAVARDTGTAAAATALLARWPDAGEPTRAKTFATAGARLGKTLGDGRAALPDRVAALRGLLALAAHRAAALEAAGKLLGNPLPGDAQAQVVAAVAAAGTAEAAKVLVASFARLSGASRDAALAALLSRPAYIGALLGEIEGGRLRPLELGPNALFRLRSLPDKALATRARSALDAILGEETKEKDTLIATLLPQVSRPGDAGKGHEAFAKNCLVCHSYKGEGVGFAPDLAGMGARGPAELLVHIVDPNRHVEPNFIAFDLATKSGTSVNGILVRETADAVVLRNANGQVETRRSDIASFASSGLSLMPTGFEALGSEVLRDMLTYLCGEAGRYRTLDLGQVANASTRRGLFDGDGRLRLATFGTQTIDDVVFELVDPAKSPSGNNALVLGPSDAPNGASGGGNGAGSVDLRLGFPLANLHVLGGIAGSAQDDATGAGKQEALAKVVYHYVDGRTEEKVLRDGVEFATWRRRVDVPGSRYVTGLLPEGVPGQVRRFSLAPARPEAVERVTLTSLGGKRPTFLAVTAELPEVRGTGGAAGAAGATGPRVLLVGGGASHDFDRFWKGTEVATIGGLGGSGAPASSKAPRFAVTYTANPAEVARGIPAADVLYLANNQPLPDPDARAGIFAHVERGRGLLLGHAATWYNWKDWGDYNRRLVAGGASGHEKYGEFEVAVVNREHPVMKGVPATFRIKDELYRFTQDATGPAVTVLATGRSLTTGAEYPVVWTVQHPSGRIVCVTLGHDGAAHDHPAYKALLANALKWLAKR